MLYWVNESGKYQGVYLRNTHEHHSIIFQTLRHASLFAFSKCITTTTTETLNLSLHSLDYSLYSLYSLYSFNPWEHWDNSTDIESLEVCTVHDDYVSTVKKEFRKGLYKIPPATRMIQTRMSKKSAKLKEVQTGFQETKLYDPVSIQISSKTLVRDAFQHMIDTNSPEQSPESVFAVMFPKEEQTTDIFQLPADQWTSDVLAKFFSRPGRFSNSPYHDPELIRVSEFRRYGPGMQFEFLCHWKHPNSKKQIKTWQKWIHLCHNHYFQQLLQNVGWSMDIEKDQNFEETQEYINSLYSDDDETGYDAPEMWRIDEFAGSNNDDSDNDSNSEYEDPKTGDDKKKTKTKTKKRTKPQPKKTKKQKKSNPGVLPPRYRSKPLVTSIKNRVRCL